MTTRKKMIETLVSVLFIFAMVVILILFISYGGSGRYKLNIVGLYAEKENSLDMVYVGGSACYVYWEALKAWDDYGYTSYSFAVDCLTPQSIKYLIQEARKTQAPKLWVIDLRPFQYGDSSMYDDAFIRNVTDSLRDFDLRKQLIDISVLNKSERLDYYFPALKYHGQAVTNVVIDVFHLLTGELNLDDVKLNTENRLNVFNTENRLKGFVAFIEQTMALDFTDCNNVTEIKPLEGVVNEYFLDLLDYCKTEGITPLFVVHSYCQEAEHKQKYNYMKQVIKSYGFDYLNTNDYYQEIGLDYSFDLYNKNHVNVFGADKYTDFLAAYIDDKYDMPDHRNDPVYAEWDVCAEEFFTLAEKTKQAILSYSEMRAND